MRTVITEKEVSARTLVVRVSTTVEQCGSPVAQLHLDVTLCRKSLLEKIESKKAQGILRQIGLHAQGAPNGRLAPPNAVLIVGAGPTGLTLAVDLARRGVPFRIIDAKSGPTADSKGLALNISSRYGLQLLGLGDRIGARANPVQRLDIHWQGRPYAGIDFGRLRPNLHHLLLQAQAETELDLLHALQALGHEVEWGRRLLETTEREHGVTAYLQGADDEPEQAEFAWMVGCDGKHSVVRKLLNAEFKGRDYPMHFVLGDFLLPAQFNRDRVRYCVYEDGFFILVPFGDSMWRIVVKYDGAPPERAPAVADITDFVRARMGADFDPGPCLWISRAPFYHRVAQRLSSARQFIAGDAAHLFSPIGGTGMNTGMQDVFNLGWKLAAVYHGQAEAQLLESYATERLAEIEKAAQIADLSTRLICGQEPSHPLLADLAPRMHNRGKMRRLFPRLHSGLGAKMHIPGADNANPAVGCLHLGFVRAQADTSPEDARARNLPTCLIDLRHAASDEFQSLRQALAYHPFVRVRLLGDAAPTLLADETHQALPLAAQALTLVRPDGICIHSGDASTQDALLALLDGMRPQWQTHHH
jgi:2-polyprenyl-6-methoxyphenol hydroxylase-like FAD-dependent oxidoreductase